MADIKTQESELEEPELIASDVDELTHAELLCMYRDSEANIRFSKALQWRATSGTLAIFFVIGLLAPYHSKGGDMTRLLTVLTYIIAAASIYTLVIFQSWQGVEREKIQVITRKLSSLARDIYNVKSPLAANIERFTLLGFMCAGILTGAFLTLSRLMRWLPG